MDVNAFNEGVANNNEIKVVRSVALPGANSPVAQTDINKKDTNYPAPTGQIFVKPSDLSMPAAETDKAVSLLRKNNIANSLGVNAYEFSLDGSPWLLRSDEGFMIYQKVAGTATELWQITLGFHEVII